jgi:hypothetical protein
LIEWPNKFGYFIVTKSWHKYCQNLIQLQGNTFFLQL